MKRRRSSGNWLERQRRDPFVREARGKGYRSRAALKLEHIDARFRILAPGRWVLDVGAAPGGFSQVAARTVGPNGRVVACDYRPIEPIPGVTVVEGDFTDEAVVLQLLAAAQPRGYDLVMSDAAPNVSGVRDRDEADFLELADHAVGLAERCLRPGGDLLVKLYQGDGARLWMSPLARCFDSHRIVKPDSSRGESREVFLLCRGLGGWSAWSDQRRASDWGGASTE